MTKFTTPRLRAARAGLLALIMMMIPLARAADRYVRAGANGAGTDWANALPQLPPTLTRGDTYWVASGQYPAATLAAEGADTTITIKKATAEAHGNGAGWNEAYANGPAVWGPITCSASNLVFDGVTGKGKEGHGFEIFDPSGAKSLWEFQNAPQSVTISHVNMHFKDRKSATADAVYGATPCKNITISHSYIHDIGRCPLLMREWENLLLEHCWIARNKSTAEDHAEGISTHGGGGHVIRYNTWEDIEGTAIIVNLAKPSRDWQIYGNVFFQTPGGDCTGVGHGIVGDNFGDSGISGLKYYNNSAFNITGVCSGLRFWGAGASNIVATNNVWSNCKEVGFNGVAHDNNSYYNCAMTYQFQSGAGKGEAKGAGDPYVNAAGGDLRLKAATAPGVKLEAPYNVDSDENVRGGDGTWDRGAFEFGGTKVAGADGKSNSTAGGTSSTGSTTTAGGSTSKGSGSASSTSTASTPSTTDQASSSAGGGFFSGVRVSDEQPVVTVSRTDQTTATSSTAAATPTPIVLYQSGPAVAPVTQQQAPQAASAQTQQAAPAETQEQTAQNALAQGLAAATQQNQATPASGSDATSSSESNKGGGRSSRKSSRRGSSSGSDPASSASHDDQTAPGATGYMSAALASPAGTAATYSIPEVQDENAATTGAGTVSFPPPGGGTPATGDTPAAPVTPMAAKAIPTSATMAAAPATSATNPNQGLVVALSFDRVKSGLVEDASGQGNAGTVQGAAWSPAGKFGGCLVFDGDRDRVTINDAPSLAMKDGLTIEAWIHPVNTLQGWRNVVTKERPQGADYHLYANTEHNQPGAAVFVKNEVLQIGGARPALNVWTHIAATYDGKRQRLYLNGMLVADRRQNGPIQSGAGALRIGGNAIWGEGFMGRIDELRIYNRALKMSEILRDMATPVK